MTIVQHTAQEVNQFLRRLPSAPGLLESGQFLDMSVENGASILSCAGLSPSIILREVLLNAQTHQRLTFGSHAAGKLMSERNLSKVLACILVDEHSIEMDMNCVLIGAFCQENGIRIIKVSSLSGLAAMLKKPDQAEIPEKDMTCVVIEHSKDGVSTIEDNILMNYYQLHTRDGRPLVINLPS